MFYKPTSTAHHVVLREKPLLAALAALPPGQTRWSKLRAPRAVRFEAGSDDPEALVDFDNDARQEKAHARAFQDKLYGVPVDGPQLGGACRRCKKPLTLLAQMISVDDWFVYYLQICPSAHEVSFQAKRA